MSNQHQIEQAIASILYLIGEDPHRPGLTETPKRVAKALQFWTSGYQCDPEAVIKTFVDGAEDYDEMVCQSRIEFYSLCEHHMAPIFGVAHLAYVPAGRIIGLSKLSRIVDIFARRLQTQERMTTQIANCLWHNLKPIGVGVVLQARHLCMESRGIQKVGTITTTSALHGAIKDKPEARAEFLQFVHTASRDLTI